MGCQGIPATSVGEQDSPVGNYRSMVSAISMIFQSVPYENGYTYTPGWWYTNTSEKCEFVNWDDDIPNGKIIQSCSKAPTSS